MSSSTLATREEIVASTDTARARLTYRVDDGTLIVDDAPQELDAQRLVRHADALRHEHTIDRVEVDRRLAEQAGLDRRLWEHEGSTVGLPLAAFLQLRKPWLADELVPITPEVRCEAECPEGWHPRRPRLPEGRLFAKRLPDTGEVFSLRRASVDEHGELFHTWQNRDYVAEAWNEDGTREEHDAFLRDRRQDPHIEPVIGTLDGTPFAYLEIYWAREDRIGPHCDPDPYDQGLHMLVGEPEFLGGPRTSAWMRAVFQFMFLREPRTSRLVGEPEVGNERVLARVRDTGWHKEGEFDFPHKRAALVTLDRQRFFQEERP